jgi:hypothetical protein
VRQVIVAGGVRGSRSGNSYVSYYRQGWNAANRVDHGVAPRTQPGPMSKASTPTPAPEAKPNRELEQRVRAELMKSGEDGQHVVRLLDRMGLQIRFRESGGTVYDSPSRVVYVATKKATSDPKPISWLAASVAHEVTHARDAERGRTPPTVSPHYRDYAAARANGRVPTTLSRAMVEDRRSYVRGQIDGEARAMSREARVLRGLEKRGVPLEDLKRTILDTYSAAHDEVLQRGERSAASVGGQTAP